MKSRILQTCIIIFSTYSLSGQSKIHVSGSWIGNIKLGGESVELVINIADTISKASLGIPSKGVASLPFEKFTTKNDSVIAEINSLKVSFKGIYIDKSNILSGAWIQGQEAYPLEMKPLLEKIDYEKSKLKNRGTLIESYKSENFIFYYEKKDYSAVDTLARSLEHEYKSLSEKLGANFENKVEVYVYPNLKQFHKAIYQPDAPNWVVGAAGVNEIKMVSPLNPGVDHTYSSLLQAVIHEFVHVAVLNIRNNNLDGLPHWLNEGVAFFEANQMTQAMRESIKKSIEKDEISSWNGLMLANPIEFGELGGYPKSALIVEFLIEEFGYNKLKKLILNPSNMKSIYNMSQTTLEDKWIEYVKLIN